MRSFNWRKALQTSRKDVLLAITILGNSFLDISRPDAEDFLETIKNLATTSDFDTTDIVLPKETAVVLYQDATLDKSYISQGKRDFNKWLNEHAPLKQQQKIALVDLSEHKISREAFNLHEDKYGVLNATFSCRLQVAEEGLDKFIANLLCDRENVQGSRALECLDEFLLQLNSFITSQKTEEIQENPLWQNSIQEKIQEGLNNLDLGISITIENIEWKVNKHKKKVTKGSFTDRIERNRKTPLSDWQDTHQEIDDIQQTDNDLGKDLESRKRKRRTENLMQEVRSTKSSKKHSEEPDILENIRRREMKHTALEDTNGT